jgi:CheY-like chemotaxis protein
VDGILTASSSEDLRSLGSRATARLGLARHVVADGRQVLETARRLRPRVVIIDVAMPNTDGYSLCREIKADPALATCRVMLVLSGLVTRDEVERFAECRCDDVVVMPAIGEEFHLHLADLLGVARRRTRRIAVQLAARLGRHPETRPGLVENLSVHGARVRLESPLTDVEALRVSLDLPPPAGPLQLDAGVVWVRDDGKLLGLEFRGLTPTTHEQLANLAVWEIVEDDGVQRVIMEGDFDEYTDFAPLGGRLRGRVEFDAEGVRYINSAGTHRWVHFLRELHAVTECSFSRCSVAFTSQAAMVPEVLGTGRVSSVVAPYHCERCGRDEERLLQTQALVRDRQAFQIPSFGCPGCGGSLVFDELPNSYLSFLPRM